MDDSINQDIQIGDTELQEKQQIACKQKPPTSTQQSYKNQLMVEQTIVTDRLIEQSEDDHAALSRKTVTPLSFFVKIGGCYLLSFRKDEVIYFIGKLIFLIFFQFMVVGFIAFVALIPHQLKILLYWLSGFNVLMFMLVFLIDPGVLFEDQRQKWGQELQYCQTCQLYRWKSTKHCHYCRKCIRNYDHHCAFFGKCIGKRNFLMFCGFVIGSGAVGMGSMGALLYSMFYGIFE